MELASRAKHWETMQCPLSMFSVRRLRLSWGRHVGSFFFFFLNHPTGNRLIFTHKRKIITSFCKCERSPGKKHGRVNVEKPQRAGKRPGKDWGQRMHRQWGLERWRGQLRNCSKQLQRDSEKVKGKDGSKTAWAPLGAFFLSHKTLLGSPCLESVPTSTRNNVLLFSVLKRKTTTKTIWG